MLKDKYDINSIVKTLLILGVLNDLLKEMVGILISWHDPDPNVE
jgi:hypothetical protein